MVRKAACTSRRAGLSSLAPRPPGRVPIIVAGAGQPCPPTLSRSGPGRRLGPATIMPRTSLVQNLEAARRGPSREQVDVRTAPPSPERPCPPSRPRTAPRRKSASQPVTLPGQGRRPRDPHPEAVENASDRTPPHQLHPFPPRPGKPGQGRATRRWPSPCEVEAGGVDGPGAVDGGEDVEGSEEHDHDDQRVRRAAVRRDW